MLACIWVKYYFKEFFKRKKKAKKKNIIVARNLLFSTLQHFAQYCYSYIDFLKQSVYMESGSKGSPSRTLF